LAALIGVENLRLPIATQRLLKGFHTEVRGQCWTVARTELDDCANP
jgi:hypothetical protein